MTVDDGNVYTWGDNSFGQLGSGKEDHRSSPKLLSSLRRRGVSKVSCGRYHTLALCEDGTIYSTSILKKSLRFGIEAELNRLPPARIFVHCAAGSNTTVGVSKSGVMYVWEYSDMDPDDVAFASSKPTKLTTLQGIQVSSVRAGYSHFAALARVPGLDADTLAENDDDADAEPNSMRRQSRGSQRIRARERARRKSSKHRKNESLLDIEPTLRSVAREI